MQDQTYQVYKIAGARYTLLIRSRPPPLNAKKGCYPSTAEHTRSPETESYVRLVACRPMPVLVPITLTPFRKCIRILLREPSMLPNAPHLTVHRNGANGGLLTVQ